MDLLFYRIIGSKTPLFVSLNPNINFKNIELDQITETISNGVTITRKIKINREPEFPNYRSWLGFEGWIETVSKAFNISRSRAYVALLHPEEDITWILNLEETTVDEISSIVTPFNHYYFDKETVLYWINHGKDNLCKLREALKYYLILKHCKPTNSREFRRCRYMVCNGNISENSNIDRLKLWRKIGGLKRSPEELLIFSVAGIVSPKIVYIFKKLLEKNSV
jgi:hypothetical protein